MMTLTVRDLRAIHQAHPLAVTYHDARDTRIVGECGCGLTFAFYVSAHEIGAAHARHVTDVRIETMHLKAVRR